MRHAASIRSAVALLALCTLGVAVSQVPAEAGKPSPPRGKGNDRTPPVITCPGNITREATASSGAVVYFSATATDNRDPAPTITYSPAPGTWFPIGVTTVTATARDWRNNTSSCSFLITVRDTTAPALYCPADIDLTSSDPDGVAVTFAASAYDAVDASPTITYSKASGSVFPGGTTEVVVTATDDAGNSSSCSFNVNIDTDPTDGPFVGTYAMAWYGYDYDGNYLTYYEWVIDVGADGSISGSGQQTSMISYYCDWDCWQILTPMPSDLSASGVISGHVTDSGNLSVTFYYGLWDEWYGYYEYGFDQSGHAESDVDGNLVITNEWGGVEVWTKQ